MGRRARSSGNDNDLWEAYRLLGTFVRARHSVQKADTAQLHTLEDLPAHSNWCELALVKLGHRDVSRAALLEAYTRCTNPSRGVRLFCRSFATSATSAASNRLLDLFRLS